MTLQDTPKPWYKSKAIWACIIIIFVSVWDNLLVPGCAKYLSFILPSIPTWIYTLLGSLGIYARASAKSPIGK